MLDFSKVKPQERADAERLFKSAAGKLMQQDVAAEAAATFTPGEDLPSNPMVRGSLLRGFFLGGGREEREVGVAEGGGADCKNWVE